MRMVADGACAASGLTPYMLLCLFQRQTTAIKPARTCGLASADSSGRRAQRSRLLKLSSRVA